MLQADGTRRDPISTFYFLCTQIMRENKCTRERERERERWLNSEQRQRKIRRFVVSYRNRCVNWEVVPLPRYGRHIQNYLRKKIVYIYKKFPYYKLAFQFLMGLTLQKQKSYVGFCFLLLSINIGKRKRVLAYFCE